MCFGGNLATTTAMLTVHPLFPCSFLVSSFFSKLGSHCIRLCDHFCKLRVVIERVEEIFWIDLRIFTNRFYTHMHLLVYGDAGWKRIHVETTI